MYGPMVKDANSLDNCHDAKDDARNDPVPISHCVSPDLVASGPARRLRSRGARLMRASGPLGTLGCSFLDPLTVQIWIDDCVPAFKRNPDLGKFALPLWRKADHAPKRQSF